MDVLPVHAHALTAPSPCTVAAIETAGGQTTMSTPGARAGRWRIDAAKARLRPLEQLPVARDQHARIVRELPTARPNGVSLVHVSDGGGVPAWEQRFPPAGDLLPEWSPAAPDRVVYASNESGVAGARLGRRSGHQAAGHGSPRRAHGRHAHAGRRGRAVVPGRDRRRVGSVVRPAVRGGESRLFLEGVPHGWNEASRRRPGSWSPASATARASPSTSPRRRSRARAAPLDGVPPGRERRGGRLRARRAVGRRRAALSLARGARRPPPRRPAGRPRTGDTVGDLLDEGMSLAARAWSPVPGTGGSLRPRARGRHAARDLGPRHRGAH